MSAGWQQSCSDPYRQEASRQTRAAGPLFLVTRGGQVMVIGSVVGKYR